MKRAMFLGILFCLVGIDGALAECKKMAVGARFAPYQSSHRSVDFLYRRGVVTGGLILADGNYEKAETKELTFLVGYWSRPNLIWNSVEERHMIGWHAYLGAGISSVNVVERYASTSGYVRHGKVGVGLDYYLTRRVVLTTDVLDVVTVAGSLPMVGELEKTVLQIGCRVWF